MEQYVKKARCRAGVRTRMARRTLSCASDIASEKITDEEGQQADGAGTAMSAARFALRSRSHRGRSHGGLRFVVGLSSAARG